MSELRLPPVSYAIVGLAAVGVALYVWKKGGLAGALKGAGGAVFDAAGQTATEVVGGIGGAVGLPTPSETTTDPRVARYLIDGYGYFVASKWSSAGALFTAFGMDAGTGYPPSADSPIARALPALASYDETERLKKRYPAPDTDVFTNPSGIDYGDPSTWGLGL